MNSGRRRGATHSSGQRPADGWKLQHWDEYAITIDPELRPVMPHMIVGNRLGAAISLTDQVRQVFGAVF